MNFRLLTLATAACLALQGCAGVGLTRDRAFVYKGEYLPRPDGFTPEGLYVRHDKVVVRYSFR